MCKGEEGVQEGIKKRKTEIVEMKELEKEEKRGEIDKKKKKQKELSPIQARDLRKYPPFGRKNFS